MLETNFCYVLDCPEGEGFVWVGKVWLLFLETLGSCQLSCELSDNNSMQKSPQPARIAAMRHLRLMFATRPEWSLISRQVSIQWIFPLIVVHGSNLLCSSRSRVVKMSSSKRSLQGTSAEFDCYFYLILSFLCDSWADANTPMAAKGAGILKVLEKKVWDCIFFSLSTAMMLFFILLAWEETRSKNWRFEASL